MPFIVTEPQRIIGTKLGFSVYPYHFAFQDHFPASRDFNQKLVIFKLKDSKFIEIEEKLMEKTYMDYFVANKFVENTLKSYVTNHPEYVTNPKEVVAFFNNQNSAEKMEEEVKNL